MVDLHNLLLAGLPAHSNKELLETAERGITGAKGFRRNADCEITRWWSACAREWRGRLRQPQFGEDTAQNAWSFGCLLPFQAERFARYHRRASYEGVMKCPDQSRG